MAGSKNRDERGTKTPPEGVARQIARPLGQRASSQVGDDFSGPEQTTDTIENPIDRIDVRTRTQSRSIELQAQSIESVRAELRGDINIVRSDVSELRADMRNMSEQVFGLQGTFSDVRADVSSVASKIDGQAATIGLLVDELTDERAARREEERIELTARVTIDQHAKIAEIDETKNRKKVHREWFTKILAIVSTIAATILALVEANRC